MCGVNLLKSWRMGGDLESTNGVREIPVMHYMKHPSKRQLVYSHMHGSLLTANTTKVSY